MLISYFNVDFQTLTLCLQFHFIRKDLVMRTVKVPCTAPNNVAGDAALPPDDGYSWRKYGQKYILGAKYPRYYILL
jgi:WRKY DNA -binding domain